MLFFHSLPVPELWEWVFFIPFPFPNCGNGFFLFPFPFPILPFHRRNSKRELEYCERYQTSNNFSFLYIFRFRSRLFPGTMASDSHSQNVGLDLYSLPIPNFGSVIIYSHSRSRTPKSHFRSPLVGMIGNDTFSLLKKRCSQEKQRRVYWDFPLIGFTDKVTRLKKLFITSYDSLFET